MERQSTGMQLREDERIIKLRTEIITLQVQADRLQVASEADVTVATSHLGLLSNLREAMEAVRIEYTGPLTAHLREVNETFGLFSEPLDQADRMTRQKVTSYLDGMKAAAREQERLNRERDKLEREEAALQHRPVEPIRPVEVIKEVPKTALQVPGAKVTQVKKWTWEVTDFAKLPDEYKLENKTLIGQRVRAGVVIPGVTAQQETQLRVSTR